MGTPRREPSSARGDSSRQATTGAIGRPPLALKTAHQLRPHGGLAYPEPDLQWVSAKCEAHCAVAPAVGSGKSVGLPNLVLRMWDSGTRCPSRCFQIRAWTPGHQHLDVDTAVYSVHSVPWTGILLLGLRLDGDHAVDLECDVISHREKRDTDETDQARLAFGLQLAETKRGIGDTKVRVGSDAKLKLDASQRNHRIAVKIPSRSARGLLPCPSRRGVAVCAK